MLSRNSLAILLTALLFSLVLSMSSFAQSAEVKLIGPYQVDTGDEIHVTVFDHDDLSGTFRIDGSGDIAFPLVGNVNVRGLNLRSLKHKIISKLKPDYLKNPRVNIEILNYRPFYIIGEISKPGSYPYVHGMTIVNAIALAGGYTDRARENRLLVIRAKDTERVKRAANPNTLVMPGDVIEIPERFF